MLATAAAPALQSPGTGCSPIAMMQIQLELQQLKAAPVLNPHFGMVMTYIDALNRLMDVAAASSGAYGVKIWMVEVQAFTRQLHKRMFQRMPLLPQERQAIMNFANYWRNAMHPMYAMTTPEAQIVLLALTEVASC